MLFIYSFVILLIFGILSLDVTGFSHLDVTWAKINQDVNMTFNLRLAGEQELVYIRFKPEGTTYVLDFISIVTSTREVQYHPSYKNRLIVETKDYPTVDVTMKMCQLTDAGDYVCMNGDKEIADCGFRVHVWESHLREISVHEHDNAKFTFKVGNMDRSVSDTVTVKFRHRGKDEPLEDVISVHIQMLNVQVSQKYTQRLLARPDSRLRLVEVKLLEVNLHDAGEYSCYNGSVKMRADGCGYVLDVLIFESEDANQVNSLEHQDVDLLFNISDTLSNTLIKVLFQHSAAKEMTEVLTLNPVNQSIQAAEGYSTRVSLVTVIDQHIFHVRLEEVTLEDDGSYKCLYTQYMFRLILGECGQKLNVFTRTLKHVVTRSWHVFTGDTVRVVCDRDRVMFPKQVNRVNEIRLRKRKWAETTFTTIAAYPENIVTATSTIDPSQSRYTATYNITDDPSTMQLFVNMTTDNQYVMEEFDCMCNLTTETESLILYSLISLVTVRYLKDTSVIEGSTTTMTFNLMGVEDHLNGPLQIMFRRLHSNEHEQVLSVHMPEMTVSVSTAFASRSKHSVDPIRKKLDLQLLNVSLDETGDFYCFAGSQEVHLPGCGYKLTVEVEESDDLSQVNTLEYRDIEIKLPIVPATVGSELVHVKFEGPTSSADVLTLDPVTFNAKVNAHYSTRFYSVDSHPSLKLGLHHATLADDGFFRCYLGERMTWLPECGVKLNVFASRVKPVIAKSWQIFEGDNVTARCDKNRIPTFEKITRTASLVFRFRKVKETRAENIAACTVTDQVKCVGVGKYIVKHVPEMGNMSDYTAMEINIDNVRAADSGEYHCHWTVDTETGRKNISSMASLVNVREYQNNDRAFTTQSPKESQNIDRASTTQLPKENVHTSTATFKGEVLKVEARENEDLTIAFNLAQINSQIKMIRIKFQKENEQTWTDLVEIYRGQKYIDFFKSQTDFVSISLNEDKSQLFLRLPRVTHGMVGNYKCFEGSSLAPVLADQCDYIVTLKSSVAVTTVSYNRSTQLAADILYLYILLTFCLYNE